MVAHTKAMVVFPDRLTEKLNIAELVARDDRWARGVLYGRFAPDLSRMIVRMLGTRDGALDLVHDSFVYVFEHLTELREPSRFRSWLFQIAVSQTRTTMRRRKLQRMLGLLPNSSGEERAQVCQAGQEAFVELGELDNTLSHLSTNQRIAWVLRHVEGHSMIEIAAHCGWSLSKTKRQVAAAGLRLAHLEASSR